MNVCFSRLRKNLLANSGECKIAVLVVAGIRHKQNAILYVIFLFERIISKFSFAEHKKLVYVLCFCDALFHLVLIVPRETI